ncbi:Uncharacterised protein [Mycobacterium tuberculosis]|nr:Uncharacterised protein [Mycobacterium tuberculosis]
MLNRNENGETERAQEHRNADGHEQEKVVAVRHDAVRVRGEPGVIECRDGVEDAVPNRLERVFTQGEEARNQHEGNDCLNRERGVGNALDDATDLTEATDIQVFLRDELGTQTHLTANSQCQQRGDGQGTQTTHLACHQNHCLPKS